jgi:hypothetical protein
LRRVCTDTVGSVADPDPVGSGHCLVYNIGTVGSVAEPDPEQDPDPDVLKNRIRILSEKKKKKRPDPQH